MLTKVQQVGPAKGTDKKPPTREIPRTEKKCKGFLNVLVETMEKQERSDDGERLQRHDQRNDMPWYEV